MSLSCVMCLYPDPVPVCTFTFAGSTKRRSCEGVSLGVPLAKPLLSPG